MDFNEKSQNLRYNFWMIVIIALLINLIAGIVIKIFEALFPEKLKNVYVLTLSIIIILIFIFIIIYFILKDNIENKGDIVVFLTHNKRDNNFVLFKDYFPAKDIHWILVEMLRNNFMYDSYLMNLKNKYVDEIFQYLILKLLNRMHTLQMKTLKYYISKNINYNKKRFECVNPIEIDGFKSNSFMKNDGWPYNEICLFKNAKLELGIRSMVFSYEGIKLKISWHPARTEGLLIERLTPKDFETYSFVVSYELDVSPRATIPLFISATQTSIFYNWCNEVIERAKNELDWNIYNEKLHDKDISLEYQIESRI